MIGTTTLSDAVPARPEPVAARPAPGRLLGLVGWWLLVPLAAVLLLAWAGDPVGESIRFIGTWLVAVVLPGTLLWRALVGGRSVTQDVGFGAVLGIVWQLVVWAISTAIGLPLLQWVAPVLLVSAFALVPSLRPHFGLRGKAPAPPLWWHAVLVTSLVLVMLRTVAVFLRGIPLPPDAAARHQDIWYQLGLVQMLMHHLPPPDPAVVGEPLIYHWFATASMASGSVMSGVAPPQVLMHQWPIMMAITLVLVGWAAGEVLSDRAWVGPITGVLCGVLPGGLQLTAAPSANHFGSQSIQSPTGTMAAVVMLALVGPTVLILRRQATRGVWVAMILLLALCAGTKPTLLPIMLAGCVVAGAFSWFSERRPPWRLAALAGLSGLLFVASSFVLVGSSGGSRIQFLAALRALPYYQYVTGDKSYPATGGWLVPSVASGNSRLLVFAATLVFWYLVTETPRLLALLGLTIAPVRRDPAYWWIGGCVAAGTSVTLVFSQSGYSEFYFLNAILAVGMVGVVAVGADLAGHLDRRSAVIAAAAGIVTAVALYLWWPTQVTNRSVFGAFARLVVPDLILAVVAAVVILLVNRARGAAAITVQLIVLTIAASLPLQLIFAGKAINTATKPAAQNQSQRTYLTRPEQQAMMWLYKNKAVDDIAVTNVFCAPVKYKPGCLDDAFWISGLSGVRQYLGGWAYTPTNLAASQHRTSFLMQPSPWPDRLKDSLDAVRKPTPQLLSRLKQQAGVDWIVADLRATPVSPELDSLAVRAYSNKDVRIYRLR
ncbi:MAG TPA: hypothetical protein VGD34_22045 [Kribbella sp.]